MTPKCAIGWTTIDLASWGPWLGGWVMSNIAHRWSTIGLFRALSPCCPPPQPLPMLMELPCGYALAFERRDARHGVIQDILSSVPCPHAAATPFNNPFPAPSFPSGGGHPPRHASAPSPAAHKFTQMSATGLREHLTMWDVVPTESLLQTRPFLTVRHGCWR